MRWEDGTIRGDTDIYFPCDIFLLPFWTLPTSPWRTAAFAVRYTIRYEIRDAILTFNQKMTRVSLIYRTEPTTKKLGKTEKIEGKITDMLRSIDKQSGKSVELSAYLGSKMFRSIPIYFNKFIQGGPKNRTVFRLYNFVTVSPRKACSMSKFSQFYREKSTKLAFQWV